MKNKIISFLKQGLLFLIRLYQKFVSPFLGSQCRFHPSCSHYAEEAVVKKGILLGLCFSFGRLMRCHPFCPGGFDSLE